MSKKLTETQVLKKLGIPDFRHLSKENVMSFASMIQDMDPEVAMKAIEQFPDFAKTAIAALTDYRSVLEKSLADDKESANQCFEIYNKILDALTKCLEKDDLSFEERQYYIEQMKEIANMASQKDSEGKKFKWANLAAFGTLAITIIAGAASLLGGNSKLGFPPFKNS